MDIFKMRRETKILITLIVIAFLIRLVFVFSTPVKIWDETVYANLGYNLAQNPLDYSVANNGWSDFIPSFGEDFYSWPRMGFRAPLLPYTLMLFYLFNLDFLIIFSMAVVGTLSVYLVYLLGKKIFNERVGIYSSIFLTLIPLHVICSGNLLTETLFTFFLLLTFFSFWKGYEEKNNKHKVIFGLFLALALLSRYTALWIMPVFLLYFLTRDRSIKFLKDKYLWYAILVFFITISPWLIYSTFEYHNPIGAFIHGAKASAYWGGVQSWHFFFDTWLNMFSGIGVIFLIALIYIFYKKQFLKREIYLILIWFAFFLGMAIYMPHKEERFILAIVPPIVLISGYFLDRIKNYSKLILGTVILISLLSLSFQAYITYNNSYTDTNTCFLEGSNFLKNVDKNSVIITDESSVVYYYTKKETRFYPDPWSQEAIKNWVKWSYPDKDVYVLFGSYIIKPEKEYLQIKEGLEKNSKKVFECSKEKGYSAVYKI